MKITHLINYGLIILCIGCNAQNDSDENKSIDFLKEFYTMYAYSDINFTVNDYKKFESIAEKYCSSKFAKEVKRHYNDVGIDALTYDYGIDEESLSTLKIEKDLSAKGLFIVSYVVDTYPVSPTNAVKKKISFKVSVTEEKGKLKIDSVE